jgi:hypothetical protein
VNALRLIPKRGGDDRELMAGLAALLDEQAELAEGNDVSGFAGPMSAFTAPSFRRRAMRSPIASTPAWPIGNAG